MRIDATEKALTVMLAAVILSVAPVFAGDATWSTNIDGNWEDMSKWSPSDTFPNAPGDVASLNINIFGDPVPDPPINGTRVTTINQDITVGTLNWGDADGINDWQIAASPAATHNFIFEAATPGGNTFLNTTAQGTSTNRFMSSVNKVILGGTSSLVWTVNSTGVNNSHTIRTDAVFDTNGNDVTITNLVAPITQRSVWDIHGDLLGDGTITYSAVTGVGSGGINVIGTKSFTGRFVINNSRSNGGLDFGGLSIGTRTTTNGNPSGAIPDAAEIVINGRIVNNNNRENGGVVVVGDGVAVLAANPGQRLTQNLITFNGGALDHRGARSNGSWSDAVQDTVATINFNSAYNSISAFRFDASTAGTYINATTVQRGAGASVYAHAATWGGVTRFVIGNANSHLTGAGGGDGTTTMSIIPWMVATTTYDTGHTVAPVGFVTHTATGIRPLVVATEYATSITAGASHNVNTASLDLGGVDRTVNSLRFAANTTQQIGAGRTLTIASGGLFFVGSNGFIGSVGNAEAGTLSFGAAEGVIWAVSGSFNQIGSEITGSGGLTKAGTGRLSLTGPNTYTGTTHVSGGRLDVGTLSNLGNGDVHVHNGALLFTFTADAIDDGASLILDAYGTRNGKVEVGAGLIETVAGLSLGGVFQGMGYYGSTAAAAAFDGIHVVNVNDVFFTGSGLIHVIPEPASMLLLAAGSLLVAGRRRRL